FGQPAVYTDEPTDSVCDLGGVALQGSIADTPEAQWVDYHGVWLPTSSKYGPGNYAQNGEFSCFEHSPRGMLFAASAYTGHSARASFSSGRLWVPRCSSPSPRSSATPRRCFSPVSPRSPSASPPSGCSRSLRPVSNTERWTCDTLI